MSLSLERIDGAAWDAELLASPYASPFHEYAWNTMAAEQFNQEFQGLKATHGEYGWLIPVYRQGEQARTSFIAYGGPLALHEVLNGKDELKASLHVAAEVKKEHGASSLQGSLYPAYFWPESVPPNVDIAQTALLSLDSEDIFNDVISGNCRTAVRKAIKSGVHVRQLEPSDSVYEEVTILLNRTQQSVGSNYLTEVDYLRAIGDLDEPNIVGQTSVAELDGCPIAMSTVVTNRRMAFHLFSGWNRDFASVCANQALHWHNITQAQERRVDYYNMGESHTPELLAAKLRWGSHLAVVPKISL